MCAWRTSSFFSKKEAKRLSQTMLMLEIGTLPRKCFAYDIIILRLRIVYCSVLTTKTVYILAKRSARAEPLPYI